MIINLGEATKISNKLKDQGKIVVLVGGCFDILHVGHVRFLGNARKSGDSLFILLENDENVRKLKGPNRPFNTQKDRAEVLSQIKSVDYVVLLRNMQSDKSYDKLLIQLNPAILATTQNDPGIRHKKRQADMINAQVKIVLGRLKNYSSTKLSSSFSKK